VSYFLGQNGVDTDSVRFFEYYNDSSWTRDYGPIPVASASGAPAIVDAIYYPDRQRDDALPTLLARYLDLPVHRPPVATEGGNFMTHGEGLCAVTSWMLEENPDLSEGAVRDALRDYFGCTESLILEVMNGEGTGHIDMFAKFASRDTVLVGSYLPSDDPVNATILDRHAARLAAIELADGTSLRVVRVPMPRPEYPVYRSYTNSLIVNDTVLVPVYRADREYEAEALAAYREAFGSGYEIVTIDAEDPIQMGGAVHCTTMGFVIEPLEGTPIRDSAVSAPLPEAPASSGSETWESEPDAPIRDLDQTTDTINVSTSGAVEGVEIELDIEHSYIGDLLITLVKENVEVELHRQTGASDSHLVRSYTSTAFDGLDRSGEWRLVIEDRAEEDEGRLIYWALTL